MFADEFERSLSHARELQLAVRTQTEINYQIADAYDSLAEQSRASVRRSRALLDRVSDIESD